MAKKYSAGDIQNFEGLAGIRNRPTEFLNSKGVEGQTHTIRELCDNSNDELMQLGGGAISIYLFRDRSNNRYQILVIDNGRGIPFGKCVDCLTRPGTSGKFSANGAYWASGGLFGKGSKVAAALSTRYKAISIHEDGTTMFRLKDSILQDTKESPSIPNSHTGTIILFEPDPTIYTDVTEYMESGYLDLVPILRTWSIFNNFHYIYKVYDRSINEKYWTADLSESLDYIHQLTDPANPDGQLVYDSDQDNPQSAMHDLLQIKSPIVWDQELIKEHVEGDRLAFHIKMLLAKKPANASIQFLNGIPIPNLASDHVSTFYRTLNRYLCQYIERDDLRNFFLSSGYQTPIYTAINVRYDQAELSGTTKDSFRDRTFSRQYATDLETVIQTVPVHLWKNLVDGFIDDLEDKFNIFYNKPRKIKDQSSLLLSIKKYESYASCEVLGPQAELFIVEGKSAGGIKKNRDTVFQAVYMMQGKPSNAVIRPNQTRKSIAILQKDESYSDLIKLSGIRPGTDDLSHLNFGKFIITSDADPDGDHITSIDLGDLYMLSPAIIEQGYVWVATPPLFIMTCGRKGQKFYLRDKLALYDARINLAYRNAMDVEIYSEYFKKPIKLKDDAFREFCHIVLHLGDQMVHSANVLNLPLLILERLVYGLQYLIPQVQLDKLKIHFGENSTNTDTKLAYYQEEQILLLSMGDTDYPIALRELDLEIRKNILPYIKQVRGYDWMPIVTSRYDKSIFNHRPCTLMQVYLLLESLNRLFTVDRKKGLGEMDEEDVITTLLDVNTRSLYHITCMGDINKIYQLLGQDSAYRKYMLKSSGMFGGQELNQLATQSD